MGRPGLRQPSIDIKLLRFTDEQALRGEAPQDRALRILCATICFLLCAVCLGRGHVQAEQKLRSPNDLDGYHLTLGPTGNAMHLESEWDSLFGLEVGLYRVREHQNLSAIGLVAGGGWYSARTGGRAWLQLEAATNKLGPAVGLGAGPTVELDEIEPPRVGAQAAIWLYAGVIPFVRAGAVQETGAFVEVGIRIPLPTLRW